MAFKDFELFGGASGGSDFLEATIEGRGWTIYGTPASLSGASIQSQSGRNGEIIAFPYPCKAGVTYTISARVGPGVNFSGSRYTRIWSGGVGGTVVTTGNALTNTTGFSTASITPVSDATYWFGVDTQVVGGTTYVSDVVLGVQGDEDPNLEDTFYDQVSLLLPFSEASGSTTTTGSGPDAETGTFASGALVADTVQKFGNNAYFDGTSVLTIPDADKFDFADDDFTIEMWVNRAAADDADGVIYEKGGQSITLYYSGANNLDLYCSTNESSWNLINALRIATNPSRDTWHHVAVTRKGNIWRTFFNGALTSLAENSGLIATNTDPVSLGGKVGLTNSFQGRLDDVRVTKGVARYTAPFDPPTVSLPTSAPVVVSEPYYDFVSLLVPFDGSATDFSNSEHTVTLAGNAQIEASESKFAASSLLLDGNDDYASIPDDETLRLAGSDFTIEAWVRFDVINSYNTLACKFTNNVVDEREWMLRYDNATSEWNFVYSTDGNNDAGILFAHTPVINTWYHVAVTRSGNDLRMFIDGAQIGTTQTLSATIHGDVSPVYIGMQNNGSTASPGPLFELDGRVNHFRITKGYARYTAAFTAPAAAFGTARDETFDPFFNDVELLIDFDGTNGSTTFTDTSGNSVALTANGNAQLSTTDPKFGTAAGEFDGSGDYVSAGDVAALELGSSDWTIEGFVNLDSIPSSGSSVAFIGKWGAASGTRSFICGLNTSGAQVRSKFTFSTNGVAVVDNFQNIDTPNTNEWYHYAFVCRDGVVTHFWNGESVGTVDVSGIGDTAQALNIGAINNGAFDPLDGQLDEHRVTIGVARYLASFTPPSQAFATSLTPPVTVPVIDTQPTNQSVNDGATATFTVAATSSGGTLTYQWYDASDDSVISGETAATYDFVAAVADDGNTYYVIVTDDNDSVQSDTVSLAVASVGPTITTQPVDQTVDELGTATFTVAATGNGTLTYQWYDASDDSVISGETAATYDFTVSADDDFNTYYVIVTDDDDSLQSNTVTLTVNDLNPTITTQPVDLALNFGETGSFTVVATAASGILTYQWFTAGGDPIAGETTDTYTLSAVGPVADLQALNGSQFVVVVTDDTGSVTSNIVEVSVTTETDLRYNLFLDPYRNPIYKRGFVKLNRQLLEGETLEINRKTPIETAFEAVDGQPFPTEQFEYTMDKATFILQELEGRICDCRGDTTIVVDPGNPIDPGETGPECQPYQCDAIEDLYQKVGFQEQWVNITTGDPAWPFPDPPEGFVFAGAASWNAWSYVQLTPPSGKPLAIDSCDANQQNLYMGLGNGNLIGGVDGPIIHRSDFRTGNDSSRAILGPYDQTLSMTSAGGLNFNTTFGHYFRLERNDGVVIVHRLQTQISFLDNDGLGQATHVRLIIVAVGPTFITLVADPETAEYAITREAYAALYPTLPFSGPQPINQNTNPTWVVDIPIDEVFPDENFLWTPFEITPSYTAVERQQLSGGAYGTRARWWYSVSGNVSIGTRSYNFGPIDVSASTAQPSQEPTIGLLERPWPVVAPDGDPGNLYFWSANTVNHAMAIAGLGEGSVTDFDEFATAFYRNRTTYEIPASCEFVGDEI